ncbi:MAG: hypothetical protein ABJD53_16650 [Gammaproteobacteria bacterium]
MTTCRRLAAIVCCSLFLPLVASAAAAPTGAPPDQGIWQKHEYSFAFMGFTTTYSCDGLADKIKVLLIAAGARPDAKSRAGACASGFGRPDKFARASLIFYSLAPAATAASTDSKPVAAAWRSVTFAYRSPRELTTGDCELVEQFRNNVLPMFTTRNIDNRTTCVPHQESGSNISLRFESLAAAPHVPSSTTQPGGG